MAVHFIQDPRLTLISAGFLGDKEAQDGVHLRWSFDPDLGFPCPRAQDDAEGIVG